MILLSSLPLFALLKNPVFDQKTEICTEEKIIGFFSESPPLRYCDMIHSGKDIIKLKNLRYV